MISNFHLPLPNDGTSERQYLDLIKYIKQYGVERGDRTGTGTKAVHGASLRFDLSDDSIPLLTTKRIPWKMVANELFWFLSGETNIRSLLENKVTIWSDWPYAKFIKENPDQANISMQDFEKMILENDDFATAWGDLGPVYGSQWRKWQGPDGQVFDQISDVIEMIKTNPTSRRLLFHGWNVAEIDKMALPPCHLLYQFFVANGRLSLTMYQRSCDVGLGLPFNLASCALLVRMVAQQCDLKPGQLVWFGHDVHLYSNHLDKISIQLDREPRAFPKLILKNKPSSIFDYNINDIEIVGYNPDPSIKMDVAV